MAPKTTIEKVDVSREGTAVFKITGTLGFHEKGNLEKLFAECRKRSIECIVFDMSGLRSLGGGCAQILRTESEAGLRVAIAGAPTTALRFLKGKPTENIEVTGSVEEALARFDGSPAAEPGKAADVEEPGMDAEIDAILADSSDGPSGETQETSPDVASTGGPGDAGPVAANDASPIAAANADEEHEITPAADGIDGATPAASAGDADVASSAGAGSAAAETGASSAGAGSAAAETGASSTGAGSATSDLAPANELRKRIVQYNTVLSINTEFHRFSDCRSLIDGFLLTLIAQVGVESAVFIEHNKGYYVPVSTKGIDAAEVRGLALSAEQLGVDAWLENPTACAIDECPFGDDVKAPLLSLGCSTVAPLTVQGDVRGFVLLGQPLKNELDDSTLEFLHMVISQAALAYGSMVRFEQENERTLGLVQTLISLIEENTLARGNTNLISNYVYALAGAMHYPEEHVRDLMYGTVLRDIGMIKVSDLIVRSPRELLPEEWEIIKRHPIDGSEMLGRMRFSGHAVAVVRSHHERFNGEGYPDGLQGQDVPLGARIVSVVESFAAMLQERPTRPALTREEALHTLKENWGMRYDPEVITKFVEIVEAEIRSGESINEERFELFNV